KDVVVAIDVETLSDVIIGVRGNIAEFSATLRNACDDSEAELTCASAYQLQDGSGVTRLRVRAREPGPLYLWLFASSLSELELSVDFEEPSAAPTNEDCGTATRIEPGESVLAPVIGSAASLKS